MTPPVLALLSFPIYNRVKLVGINRWIMFAQLFKQLLQNEESHIDFLETDLGLLERLGIQNYGLLHAEAAGGKE